MRREAPGQAFDQHLPAGRLVNQFLQDAEADLADELVLDTRQIGNLHRRCGGQAIDLGQHRELVPWEIDVQDLGNVRRQVDFLFLHPDRAEPEGPVARDGLLPALGAATDDRGRSLNDHGDFELRRRRRQDLTLRVAAQFGAKVLPGPVVRVGKKPTLPEFPGAEFMK